MNSTLLEKLKDRSALNISIKAIYKNDQLLIELIDYIKKQKYLNSKKIISTISKNFINHKPIGYAMIDKKENNIIGFLGTLYSSRIYEHGLIKQCYLHTWIVNKEFRLHSYKLLLPILNEKIFIFTYNPLKQLIGLYKKFGFKEVNFTRRLSFINIFQFFFKKNKIASYENLKNFNHFLTDYEKKILNDHKNKNLYYIFFQDVISLDYTFIIGKKVYKKFLPCFEIIYNSNYSIYKKYKKEIKFEIFKKNKNLIFLDYYLNQEKIHRENFLSLNSKNTIFYSGNFPNYNFDCLYSELS